MPTTITAVVLAVVAAMTVTHFPPISRTEKPSRCRPHISRSNPSPDVMPWPCSGDRPRQDAEDRERHHHKRPGVHSTHVQVAGGQVGRHVGPPSAVT